MGPSSSRAIGATCDIIDVIHVINALDHRRCDGIERIAAAIAALDRAGCPRSRDARHVGIEGRASKYGSWPVPVRKTAEYKDTMKDKKWSWVRRERKEAGG